MFSSNHFQIGQHVDLSHILQLKLSTMANLGTEESGHCKEVAAVERF